MEGAHWGGAEWEDQGKWRTGSGSGVCGRPESATTGVRKVRAGMNGRRGEEGVGGMGGGQRIRTERWGGMASGVRIATDLGMKSVEGCDSAEIQRPAIRSTAQTHMHRKNHRK